RNIKPGDVISAPILYDSYLAQHKEPGYESPARRSSVLEMIRHDLFRAHNSLSEAGFVRELPEKGPNNERQFVEVVYEVKNTEGLVKDIVDFTARYAPLYGPGSGREKEILAPGSATVEDIYKTVALLSDNKIEILIPCSVGLTDTVKNTLSKIRQNKGEKSVVCRLFDSEDHLRDMLSIKPKDGVKRIIISDNIATKMAINNLVKIDAKLFIGVRLLSVVLPENYNNLNRQDQGVYQADIITRAILVRLLERNGNPFVRSLFKRLIEERIESNIIENADAFIDNLIESENEAQDSEAVLKRIHYCLSIMINLVAKIGEQLIILRHFVWTAA
ncbi:MAG: hypothetical protein NTZ95_05645, partial [Candidatus Omnitrophica bacterium]|nr:hypothetical protein [Candidatus Omnitrophota bacterium]